ncbi:hypothetical protein FHT76_008213 [Rhizobium sp. BK176]|nr:hypothetical protein [Rhizobium sp. BK661]MCS4096491.1 hypothetical protein [Rhizobium sp. BK176]
MIIKAGSVLPVGFAIVQTPAARPGQAMRRRILPEPGRASAVSDYGLICSA